MSAHTPGPWTMQIQQHGNATILGDGDRFIASWALGSETDRANARLISAAPDMLEALRAAVGALKVFCEGATINTIHAALAAIAKAEGR